MFRRRAGWLIKADSTDPGGEGEQIPWMKVLAGGFKSNFRFLLEYLAVVFLLRGFAVIVEFVLLSLFFFFWGGFSQQIPW